MKIHRHFETQNVLPEDRINKLPHLGTPGTWNLFGINLPDFGLTEAIGGSFGNPQQTTFNNPLVSTIGANTPQGSYFSPSSGAQAAGPAPTPQPAPSGGGGGGDSPLAALLKIQNPDPGQQTEIARLRALQQPTIDPSAQVRSDINSGYDQYFQSLDQMLNQGLPSQRTAQEGIVQGQYGSALAGLGGQLQQAQNQLGQQTTDVMANQSKNLKDLSANLRNSFLAGNVYLGAQGAGDSSAANQYSYALTQLGNKQRGDITNNTANIMSQIDTKKQNLQSVYDSQVNQISSDRDSKISSIASWFSDAQNQLRQAQASGQLNKSQDLANLSKTILNNAMNALNQVNTQAQNSQSMLQQWAMNNATTIQGLQSNLAQVAQFNPTMPTAQPITGAPQVGAGGAMTTPIGYGSTQKQVKGYDIFGNPIYA